MATKNKRHNRRVRVINTHNHASSNSTKGEEGQNRERVVDRQNRKFFRGMGKSKAGLCAGGGDFNQPLHDPDLKKLTPDWWEWDVSGTVHGGVDHLGHKLNGEWVQVVSTKRVTGTSSDHDPIVVTYLIGGQWTITVASWNVGNKPKQLVLPDLLKLAEYCDIILLQEAGDRFDMISEFRILMDGKFGVTWKKATNPGRKVTVLHNRRKLKFSAVNWVVGVRNGIWLGPKGAGPDRSELKYLPHIDYVIRKGAK